MMSRRITAPDGSVSGAGPRDTEIVWASGAAASSPTPAKNSAYASATRWGVCLSPGRSGSSPIASRSSRTSAATRSRSTATAGSGGRGTRLPRRAALRGLLGRRLLGLDACGETRLIATLGHLDRGQLRDRALLARQPLRAGREALDVLEDLGELLVIERLLLEQLECQLVEDAAVVVDDLVGLVVRLLDEVADLRIDALG